MNSPACKTSLAKHIASDDDPLYGLSTEQLAHITGAHITTARRWRREASMGIPESIRRLLAIVVGGDEKLLREIWPACDCGLKENWRPIVGYPEYEVSDHGNVRKLANGLWKFIQTPVAPSGYCVVGLRGFTRTVHSLVLETFEGERPDGMVACHYDGVQINNHIANLRWDTQANNLKDRDRHGNTVRGERVWSSVLTEQDIPTVFDLAHTGWSRMQIAEKLDVDPTTITRVLLGESWKHVERPQ